MHLCVQEQITKNERPLDLSCKVIMNMVKETVYYERLQVSSMCTSDNLKTSYKQLALKYHPDKNPNEGERFKLISQAYKVLSDPRLRKHGEEGLKRFRSTQAQTNTGSGTFESGMNGHGSGTGGVNGRDGMNGQENSAGGVNQKAE
ncbi:DnaJ-like protein [Leptotrombidium deliense]|uniref:DnaJ-like protein n=1 Tax=Leptotrombidium deliense TaxID=299467 RepID=A0A443SQ87_9ACAR|nr:DnaJ-like protein [Leptotrombidium deliense]